MPDWPLQFVLSGPAAPRTAPRGARGGPGSQPEQAPWQAARAALEPAFTVASGRSRSVRRVWLDTFDWRLHRAGLALEQVSGSRGAELTLTGPGGERIAVQQADGSWPARLDGVPAGEVRDRLAPVAGIRALSPVAGARGVLQELQVLNGDGKTVARLTVDRMSAGPPARRGGPARVPGGGPAGRDRSGRDAADAGVQETRLVVTPVRGYQREAERVARALAASPAFSRPSLTPSEAALAAAGQRPEDYTSGVGVQLTAPMPADRAIASVLLRLLGTLEANVDGVLRDIDTEFLHDLRVSVRRTRSALKLAGDVLPDGLAERFAPEFKWLGDLTTPTRDLDVYLLGFGQMAGGLIAASAGDLAPFRDFLGRRREAERRRLARGLRSDRFAALIGSWRTELNAVLRPRPARRTAAARRAGSAGPGSAGPGSAGPGSAGPGSQPVAGLAARRTRKAYRKVLRRGSAITPDSPPEDLHTLRKRCKELRYLLEFFASLHDPADHRRVIKQLKKLQDCLGEFQDSHVQLAAVREFARQMAAEGSAPPETLLAMGELAAQIDARQRRARAAFADRFAAFTSASTTGRMKALTTAAAG